MTECAESEQAATSVPEGLWITKPLAVAHLEAGITVRSDSVATSPLLGL